MPTVLTKRVARETPKLVRMPQGIRPLIATLTPDGIELRAKGTRTRYLLPYGVAWVQGARLMAAQQAAEKKERRTLRKALR